ncbi:hypothetical protein T484DRAFT_1946622 [Baffinella frigidus]|nr:hypothetical protein T484DRAFT_1946622 [Cryptophyta sp. CCMP2293]
MWMYSIESESKAFTTIPPTGLLQQIYPDTHTTSRFQPFSIANAQAALKSSLPPPPQNNSKPTITPLGIQDPKNLSQLQIYSLMREAVRQLRSTKAWKMDASQHPHKVSLNRAQVRQLFSNLEHPQYTIKKVRMHLHPDKARQNETPEEHMPPFRNAYDFLQEVVIPSYETSLDSDDKQTFLDEAPTSFNHKLSGDIRPEFITNAQGILKHKNPEKITDLFLWPDLSPPGSKYKLGKRKKQAPSSNESQTAASTQKQKQQRTPAPPDPDTNSNLLSKRPNKPFPWEYCSKCWVFADHLLADCHHTTPTSQPQDFKAKLFQVRKQHRTQLQKQSKQHRKA